MEKAFRLLEGRGGTPIDDDLPRQRTRAGEIAFFSIATPFGDTTFRFIERKGYRALFPGFEAYSKPRGGTNAFGFVGFDHTTSNFQTMSPALLWLEHVLGFERYWEVQFHTTDVTADQSHGSGLRSRRHVGPGLGREVREQRAVAAVLQGLADQHLRRAASRRRGPAPGDRGEGHHSLRRGLRERGLEFMPTPGTYYDMLPERLEEAGRRVRSTRTSRCCASSRSWSTATGEHAYLLQIFLKEAAGLYNEPEAGPFFFEIIQRKGDQGFGAGNFRALFESHRARPGRSAPADEVAGAR